MGKRIDISAKGSKKVLCIRQRDGRSSVVLHNVGDQEFRIMRQIGSVTRAERTDTGFQFLMDSGAVDELRAICANNGIMFFEIVETAEPHSPEKRCEESRKPGRFTRCGSGWDFRFS